MLDLLLMLLLEPFLALISWARQTDPRPESQRILAGCLLLVVLSAGVGLVLYLVIT